MSQRRVAVTVLIAALLAGTFIGFAPPSPAADDGFRVEPDVTYAKLGGRELKLDLYLPPTAEGEKAPPLVVWIHGGGWRGGGKRPCPALFLVPEGYAVASLSYRFSQEAIFPAQIHDCKAAIRFLRGSAGKYGYDATRIGVMGGSAGGHLSMLLGTSSGVPAAEGDGGDFDETSSRVQAVVNFFGPSDLVIFEAQDEMKPVADRLVMQLLGGPLNETKDLARLASPRHHVTEDDAPLLSIHGEADKLVPIRQSRVIHQAYEKLGLDSTLHPIPGAGHGGPQFATPQIQKMVTEFLGKHLRNQRD